MLDHLFHGKQQQTHEVTTSSWMRERRLVEVDKQLDFDIQK